MRPIRSGSLWLSLGLFSHLPAYAVSAQGKRDNGKGEGGEERGFIAYRTKLHRDLSVHSIIINFLFDKCV